MMIMMIMMMMIMMMMMVMITNVLIITTIMICYLLWVGSPKEHLYLITILICLILMMAITYVTAAICQRWQLLIEATGFISF